MNLLPVSGDKVSFKIKLIAGDLRGLIDLFKRGSLEVLIGLIVLFNLGSRVNDEFGVSGVGG